MTILFGSGMRFNQKEAKFQVYNTFCHKKTVFLEGRCRHTGVLWNNRFYIFGGQINSTDNINDLWEYQLEESLWEQITYTSKAKVPTLDSHSACLYVNAEGLAFMIVTCGFNGDDLLSCTNQTMSYDFANKKWEVLFPHASVKKINSNYPTPRSGQSSIIVQDNLYIFGGANDDKKFNDMWTFNLISNSWSQIIYKNDLKPDVSLVSNILWT